MIVSNTTRVDSNIKNSTEFSVSTNSAKIFSFLSNFLYKEKERSVLTELTSNAMDAHAMVGKKDVPIRVTLPTELEKHVIVRDFGPGLSKENVIQFLTKYGESSKADSNDFIGGFGIGSKSPAAVTDTWTINSFHGGMNTSYLIHVNNNGIPSITELYSNPSTETGLEVIVPVKTVYPWINAAKECFKYFEVFPEICGGKIAASEFDVALLEKKFFKVQHKGYYSYTSLSVLINRREYILSSDVTEKLQNIISFDANIVIPFKTGELSVSLSREDLQYDSKTLDALTAKFEDIRNDLLKVWEQDVSSKTDVFEYRLAVSKFGKDYNISNISAKSFSAFLNDKFGADIDFLDLSAFSIEVSSSKAPYIQYVQDGSRVNQIQLNRRRYSVSCHEHKKTTGVFSLSFRAECKDAFSFVLRDKKDTPSRAKLAQSSKKLNPQVAILDEEFWNRIPSIFHKVKASDLVAPQRVKGSGAKNAIESDHYMIDGNRFVKVVLKDKLLPSGDNIYIRVNSAATISSIYDKLDKDFIQYIFGSCHDLMSHKKIRIFAVKSDVVPDPTLISVKEFLKKQSEFLITNIENIKKLIKKTQTSKSYYYQSVNIIKGMIGNKHRLNKASYAYTIIEEIEELHTTKLPDHVANLNVTMALKFHELSGGDAKFAKMLEINYNDDIEEVYPMLKYVNYHVCNEFVDTVVTYINQVGK